jgi:phosphate-selective porin OprO/OprP
MQKTTLLGGAALAVLAALGAAAPAAAQETAITWKGAPQFQNEDVTFKVRGRIYYDYVFQDVDGNPGGIADIDARNSRLRTARLGVEGTWSANWAYKAEVNFNGRDNAEWEDLILEYKPNDTTSILLGHYKSVSLENITSSRYITFMERGPFNDVIDAGRVMSLGFKMNGQNWTFQAAGTGNSLNGADVNGEERLGANARVTFAPVDTDETDVHLGAWARYRDRGDEGGFNYRARPNTNYGARYIETGGVGDSDTTFGLEGALVHKNFSVQGEYANIGVERLAGGDDPNISAWYLYGSWFPTGEMRRYEAIRGEFNRTKILNPTTAGGWGAVEVGLRYDHVDANDVEGFLTIAPGGQTAVATAPGGEYDAVTVGLNWYPFTYVRFMANYTDAQADRNFAGSFTPTPTETNPDPVAQVVRIDRDADVRTLQFRAQFDF